MSYGSWRGVVGVIKPVREAGSLEDFIRLLPAGIGVIPLFLDIQEGTAKELLNALELTKQKIAELVKAKVDLIHPEGAPIFMLRGYKEEAELVKGLEKEYGIPIFTSGMSHVESLRALGVKKIIGVTHRGGKDNEFNRKYAQYFTDAGFDVLGMEGISVPFAEIGRLSPQEVYAFAKKQFLEHPTAEGIYMVGSLWSSILGIIQILEEDLQVPVVQAIPARIWAIQKRLHVRQPIKGYGRLLEELP